MRGWIQENRMNQLSTISDRFASLKTAADELKRALKECDSGKIDALVCEEYQGINIYGNLESKQDVLDHYVPEWITITEYSTDYEQYEVYGEIGIVTGSGRISGRSGELAFQHEIMFTDLYRWTEGDWKHFKSHLTEIRETGSTE